MIMRPLFSETGHLLVTVPHPAPIQLSKKDSRSFFAQKTLVMWKRQENVFPAL